jgi:hypothetical protein
LHKVNVQKFRKHFRDDFTIMCVLVGLQSLIYMDNTVHYTTVK